MQNNVHSIAIDEAKFKKTSKKLVSKLNEQYSLNIKLNSFHELFAESLGYRNLFALQKVFQEGEQEKPTNKAHLFKELTSGQSVQLFVNLMDSQDSIGMSMWKGRAISLISALMMALVHMRDQKEIILDSNLIREYLILDNMIKLYKTRKDFPPHIHSTLRAYLMSLPGFQESAPKQNDTVLEQHGYLQMQFSPILDKLANIEKDNFVIANRSWFETDRLALKKEIKELDCIDISWIHMEYYRDWLPKAFKRVSIARILDLLTYTSMIISPEQRRFMCFLLNSLLDNFDTASTISKEIESNI